MTSRPRVQLRPAWPDDAATIAEIWRIGWRDAHLGNVPAALVAARTDESFLARAKHSVSRTTVAMVGSELAGFVMTADDEVEQLFVAARHRGAGVADALLRQAEREIADDGHRTAWLAVVPGNLRARRFYARMGWTEEGLVDYLAAGNDASIRVPAYRYVKRL